jgi:hypothetical protein
MRTRSPNRPSRSPRGVTPPKVAPQMQRGGRGGINAANARQAGGRGGSAMPAQRPQVGQVGRATPAGRATPTPAPAQSATSLGQVAPTRYACWTRYAYACACWTRYATDSTKSPTRVAAVRIGASGRYKKWV